MVLDKVDALIQEVLDYKNIPQANQELRRQLSYDLRERLLYQIYKAVIDSMPEEKITQLNELVNTPNPSGRHTQALVAGSRVNLERIIDAAMRRFKDEYTGVGVRAVRHHG